jgi:hypothetical protein
MLRYQYLATILSSKLKYFRSTLIQPQHRQFGFLAVYFRKHLKKYCSDGYYEQLATELKQ